MKSLHFAVALLGFFTSSVALNAQVTPDMAQGLTPYAEYSPSSIDNVNPLNGNLFLKIPLVSFPQRGGKLRLDYYIYYNDKQWQLPVTTTQGSGTAYSGQWNLGDPSSATGFSMTAGAYVARDQYAQTGTDTATFNYTYGGAAYEQFTITTQIFGNYIQTNDGGKHYVGDSFYQRCSSQGGGVCPTMPSEVYEYYPATDGSGFDQYGHGPDGISYVTQQGGSIPSNVVDPNGNSITATSTGLTDTYGRTIPGTLTGPGALPFPNSPRNPSTSEDGWDLIPGVPNSTVPPACPSGTTSARSWTIPASSSYGNGTATYYLCYALYSYQTAFNANTVLPPQSNTTYNFTEASSTGTGTNGQALMLTAVVLPDGLMYTFAYDQYLSLTRLGLPSGATISYSWQNILFKTDLSATSAPISRALKTRTVTPGDGQPSSTTNYHWNISYNNYGQNQFPAYSIVTDANGNDEEHILGGTDDAGNSWSDYVDLGVVRYDGCSPHDTASDRTCSPSTGTEMSAETYALSSYSGISAAYGTQSYVPALFSLPPTVPTQITTHIPGSTGERISRVIKTLIPNYGSCTVYTYPVTIYNGNQAESGISNGGGGTAPAPTSQNETNCYSTGQIATVAQYDFGAPGSGTVGPLIRKDTTSYAWQSSSTILNSNLLSLVSSDVTTNASGVWAAESDMCYDSHGNETSVQRFATQPSSESCSSPPSNAIITSTSYNSQGVATGTTDADGNPRTVTAFACNGSLPQSVTLADGNHLSYGYDCNIGKATSVKDQNDIANGGAGTAYTYDDPLSRLKSVSYPDGGSTTVDYHGDSLPLTMTVTTATGESAGPNTVEHVYDGLAREIHTYTTDSISTSIPDTITVDTNYDALGRVASVSVPYRSSSPGSTSYSYDALGRQLKLTHPDSTYQSWTYNGPTVTFQDEVGNQWSRTSDGLGRLAQVLEPNGSSTAPSMPTTYTYDALGNLISVAQTGINGVDSPRTTRSFSYDGLSRLVASYNPENAWAASGPQLTCSGASGKWATCYSYDGNGNIISKMDNRSVMINYGYDSMNRVVSKTYSSGDPSVCMQYNTPVSGSSDSYAKGNLTMEWTQSGSCPSGAQTSVPASAYTSRVVLTHDAMNRVKLEQQCPLAPCSAAYQFSYSYDLAGNVTSSNNGMPTSTSSTAAPAITWGAAYDTANRLSLVSVSSQPWSDSAHPPVLFQANQNSYSTLGNALPYDVFGHLVAGQMSLTTSSSPSTSALVLQAQYDALRGRLLSDTYNANQTTPGSGSSGSITISGSENSSRTTATAATATISINGYEQSTVVDECPPQYGGCPTTIYDSGGDTIYVNGTSAGGFGWGSGATGSSLASSLASAINGNSNSPVSATASGSNVILTSKVPGSGGDYNISVSQSWSGSYFSSPSFTVSAPSSMSGGTDPRTVYDSGTVSVTINNTHASVSWGYGSSSSSIASQLQSALANCCGSFLTASASGSAVSLASAATGTSTNWPIQISVTYDTTDFSSPSFSASPSGMGGGTNPTSNYTTLYSYTVPTGGYAGDGNLLTYSDSVMGTWNTTSSPISYDTLNRLKQMYGQSGPYQGKYGCWSYDSFGNRQSESFQTNACPASSTPVTYNQSNQVVTANGFTYAYDLAGDVTADSLNHYAYDGEGRLCAVKNYNGSYYQYVYDAEGHRVAKGTQSSLACPAPISGNGFTVESQYLLGIAGNQVTELNGSGTWQHTNAFAGGLLATYSAGSPNFGFYIGDPLGSRRVLADASGNPLETCQNLPYGNGETCTPTPMEHLFTQHERDSESGNDYLKTRYYASSMGRFLSPDIAGLAAAAPNNPQTLDGYEYVQGNPLVLTDPNGTCAEITAGIRMSPDSISGQNLIWLASQYGANVAFPYAGQSAFGSVASIALAAFGANGPATRTAAAALNATMADPGGSGKFSLGFSGGAQANLSAGFLQGQGPSAFYDPGLGLFEGIPAGVQDFTGSGFTSDLVNDASGGYPAGSADVAGCGHDVTCAIIHSDQLAKLLANAGPCENPRIFVRNNPTGTSLFYFLRQQQIQLWMNSVTLYPPIPWPKSSTELERESMQDETYFNWAVGP